MTLLRAALAGPALAAMLAVAAIPAGPAAATTRAAGNPSSPPTAPAPAPAPGFAVQVPQKPLTAIPGRTITVPILMAATSTPLDLRVAAVAITETNTGQLTCTTRHDPAWPGAKINARKVHAVASAVSTVTLTVPVPDHATPDLHLLGISVVSTPSGAGAVKVRAAACLHVILDVPGPRQIAVTADLATPGWTWAGTVRAAVTARSIGTAATRVRFAGEHTQLRLEGGRTLRTLRTFTTAAPWGLAHRTLDSSVTWTDAAGLPRTARVTRRVWVADPITIGLETGTVAAAGATGWVLARRRRRKSESGRHRAAHAAVRPGPARHRADLPGRRRRSS